MFVRTFGVAAILAAVLCLLVPENSFAQGRRLITGVVTAGDMPLENAHVELFSAGWGRAHLLDAGTTDEDGIFSVNYRRASYKDLLYVVVSDGAPGQSDLVFAATLGQVGKDLSQAVVVNELTTVATAFACAQFIDGHQIYGFSPGLDNAFATTTNLVDVQSGEAGAVVSNQNNGSTLRQYPRSTQARQRMYSLANMLVACATDSSGAACDALFALTTPVGAPAPTNTFEAIHNIARNPATFDNDSLLLLAQTAPLYRPMLLRAPEAWILMLHFTEGGFNAPGRTAFDSKGNVWVNNNFNNSPPDVDPGEQLTVLSPTGEPILGSPIINPLLSGSGYGISIDQSDNCWISNFGNGDIVSFNSRGRFRSYIPSTVYDEDPPVKAMGTAIDQDGNLWVTNMGDSSDPLSNGSITVFIKGNRRNSITFPEGKNDGLIVRKPFSVAIDARGRAWVANSGFAPIGVGNVAVLKLNNRGKIKVVAQIDSPGLGQAPDTNLLRKYGDFSSPKTIAIDQKGNGWISNFESNKVTFIDRRTFEATDFEADPSTHGWGLAVDGSNQIWVASFTNDPSSSPNAAMAPPRISVMQGKGRDRGELLFSFSNPSFQHITGLQIDASGNVWICNNWTLDSTKQDVIGGDGLVQFIGVATPVKTPLIGPPENPEFYHPRFGFDEFGPSKWFPFDPWWFFW